MDISSSAVDPNINELTDCKISDSALSDWEK